MKLLLINPRDNNGSLNPTLNNYIKQHPQIFVMKHPSLPLLTVAALTPPDIEVEYVDENAQEINFDHKADLVGITAMTQQAPRAYEIADEFRKRGNKVVLGGIHATVLPLEAKQHADFVVIGEAEEIWETCISDFSRGKAEEFYKGPIADITKSPVPRYDLLKTFDFSGTPYSFVPMQFTRGCPHNCSFCTVTHIYGRKCRTKEPKQIKAELDAILANCRFKNLAVKINDDNPFMKPAFAKKALEVIKDFKMKWFALADVAIADQPEILKLLREAGCISLGIGFESIDPNVLDEISPWKKKHLKSYPDAIRQINREGMLVAGSFMFGFDHDTRDTFKRVRDFVLEHKFGSKYSIVTPYPGTRFYDELEGQGRINKEISWRNYNFLNAVYQTKMDPRQIEELLCWLYEETWNEKVLAEIREMGKKIIERRTACLSRRNCAS